MRCSPRSAFTARSPTLRSMAARRSISCSACCCCCAGALVGAAQLSTMLAFTIIATRLPPDYWLHPFAPLLKNLPIAAAILVMIALEA